MRPSSALAAALVSVLAPALSWGGAAGGAEAEDAPPSADRRTSRGEAVAPVDVLPPRYRSGHNEALLAGVDDDFVLYHSGHIDPMSENPVYSLASLADGHVVRRIDLPGGRGHGPVLRLVDGSVITVLPYKGIERSDAADGTVTGRIPWEQVGDVVAVDDEWVLTSTDVVWFDGRVVPLDRELSTPDLDHVILRGDSDLAVVSGDDALGTIVVDPAVGSVVPLARPGEGIVVFAARGGEHPVVYGSMISSREDGASYGLVTWTDPARAAGRTVRGSHFFVYGGGLVGGRLIALVNPDGEARGTTMVEVDTESGALGETLTTQVAQFPTLHRQYSHGNGMVFAQGAGGLVVSRAHAPEGELVVLEEDAVRSIGRPAPSPLEPGRLFRYLDRVEALFYEENQLAGSAALTIGDGEWTDLDRDAAGPALSPDPVSPAVASCADGRAATVADVRGRWQLERCYGARQYFVTDRRGVIEPWEVDGSPQLGEDYVATYVASEADFRVGHIAMTGLDARHRTRLSGPSRDAFSVDLVAGGDLVYTDAEGRVRTADPSGLADVVPPVVTVDRAPGPHALRAPVRLTIAGRARDAVDGSRVVVRVEARRAAPLRAMGRWSTVAGSSDGSGTVTARAGEQWCLRVRATDRSGNVTLTVPRCTVATVDDAGAVRSGDAHRSRGVDYLGGAATVLAGPRGHVAVRGRADSATLLVFRTGPGRGGFKVRSGGREVLSGGTAESRSGVKVVRVRATGHDVVTIHAASGRPVVLDAIGVQRPQ